MGSLRIEEGGHLQLLTKSFFFLTLPLLFSVTPCKAWMYSNDYFGYGYGSIGKHIFFKKSSSSSTPAPPSKPFQRGSIGLIRGEFTLLNIFALRATVCSTILTVLIHYNNYESHACPRTSFCYSYFPISHRVFPVTNKMRHSCTKVVCDLLSRTVSRWPSLFYFSTCAQARSPGNSLPVSLLRPARELGGPVRPARSHCSPLWRLLLKTSVLEVHRASRLAG